LTPPGPRTILNLVPLGRHPRPRPAAQEVTGVPVARRGKQARPWHSCLAAWFAVLVAIAPLARPSLPDDLAPAPASFDSVSAARDQAVASAPRPAPHVRPAQPVDLGVLVRWSWLETRPGLAPVPPAAGRARVADRRPVAPGALRAHAGDPVDAFQPSSVGTARRPTGPPAPASAFA
jgi:hypothetical protein